jgi:hypothetical protein
MQERAAGSSSAGSSSSEKRWFMLFYEAPLPKYPITHFVPACRTVRKINIQPRLQTAAARS